MTSAGHYEKMGFEVIQIQLPVKISQFSPDDLLVVTPFGERLMKNYTGESQQNISNAIKACIDKLLEEWADSNKELTHKQAVQELKDAGWSNQQRLKEMYGFNKIDQKAAKGFYEAVVENIDPYTAARSLETFVRECIPQAVWRWCCNRK